MDDRFNILDVYYYLKKRWRLALGAPAGIAVMVLICTLFQPKIYRAQVSILPLGETQYNLVSLLSNFTSGQAQGNSQQFTIISLFHSRTFAERVQDRFDSSFAAAEKLSDPFNATDKDGVAVAAVGAEQKGKGEVPWSMSITPEASGNLLSIEVDSHHPVFSAFLANGIVDELHRYINDNAFTRSTKYRGYIGTQLTETRRQFLEQSKELAEFYVVNKISGSNSHLDADIGLVALDNAPKDGNSVPGDFEQISFQIRQLEKKKKDLEKDIQKNVVIKDIPEQVYLEYLNTERDILGQLQQLLARQYELAKISEAKEGLNFQVIDSAHVPTSPFKPNIPKTVLLSYVTGWLMTVFFIFADRYIARLKSLYHGH